MPDSASGRAWPPPRYGMRLATSNPGRDVACCSHQPPCVICHSARARDIPDARIKKTRLRGCGGRPAHFPVPLTAVRAWLVQPTHRAAHSARCGVLATPYRAPSNMQRATGNTVHRATHAARGTGRERGASVPHTVTTKAHWDQELCACGRRHACARDLSVRVCMCMQRAPDLPQR
jgi:hypothetical protein